MDASRHAPFGRAAPEGQGLHGAGRGAAAALALAALLLAPLAGSGCSTLKRVLFRSRYNKGFAEANRARFQGKRIIAVVYEGVLKADGKRENVYQFDKSAAVDEALTRRMHTVVDRGRIQAVLEAATLPESGSFRSEDLGRIERLAQADILLIGRVAFTERKGWLGKVLRPPSKAILRAVDLHTHEVIHTVETARMSRDTWQDLTLDILSVDLR